MEVMRQQDRFSLRKEGREVGFCTLEPGERGGRLTALWVDPAWRRRGYGSYLLKQVLQATGGYARAQPSLHTAPLPAQPGELAFWQKFGFAPQGGGLCRRRTPDLTAVALAQEFLAPRLPRGGFAIDATCGNGHDTQFLCRAVGPQGRVLALDLQAQAVAGTRARLEAAGLHNARVVQGSHADLLRWADPGSADCVMFNFGWLPGADHQVYSGPDSSIPALQAALTALRPGGVLSAVLYSGKGIGSGEKQALLAWLRALPLTRYTLLECRFANWADTAPLPCFVLKK